MNALSRMEREAFEKGRRYGTKSSIESAVAALALGAADSGLCKNTVERMIAKSFKTFSSICEGRLTFDDVRKTLEEEYDIYIDFRR